VRKLKLHWWILIGMAIGAILGAIAHARYPMDVVQTTWVYETFDGVARLFLNLLEMIVVPLIFFSLVSGMLSMGDVARLGRLGIKTLVLYMLTSMLAIGLGLILVNVIRPGVGVDLSIPTVIVEKEIPTSGWDVLIGMLPGNIIEAAADFELLALIVFALLFGAAMLSLKGPRRDVLFGLIEAGADVMMGVTRYILYMAPIGIAALIARMVSTAGLEMFVKMKWYILTVFLALAGHALITLPVLIYAVSRLNAYRYYRAISPALLTGFSTASSNATLPVTLEQVEESGGVSNRIASFVLPLGATINLDGTALYEIVSVLFIALTPASS
jgi:Na+/H+-dicarboxylate symporter